MFFDFSIKINENHQKYDFFNIFRPLAGDFCWRRGWEWGGGTKFLFNTKIQNSTAAAVEFWILLATNTYLVPNFKIQNSAAAAAEFWILNFAKHHYLINSKNQNYKLGRAGGRILDFNFC